MPRYYGPDTDEQKFKVILNPIEETILNVAKANGCSQGHNRVVHNHDTAKIKAQVYAEMAIRDGLPETAIRKWADQSYASGAPVPVGYAAFLEKIRKLGSNPGPVTCLNCNDGLVIAVSRHRKVWPLACYCVAGEKRAEGAFRLARNQRMVKTYRDEIFFVVGNRSTWNQIQQDETRLNLLLSEIARVEDAAKSIGQEIKQDASQILEELARKMKMPGSATTQAKSASKSNGRLSSIPGRP